MSDGFSKGPVKKRTMPAATMTSRRVEEPVLIGRRQVGSRKTELERRISPTDPKLARVKLYRYWVSSRTVPSEKRR